MYYVCIIYLYPIFTINHTVHFFGLFLIFYFLKWQSLFITSYYERENSFSLLVVSYYHDDNLKIKINKKALSIKTVCDK